MTADIHQLVLGHSDDLPPASVSDHVLVAWLAARLGRSPVFLEVLELRALLTQIARRRSAPNRWASWWRRLPPLRRPSREDLVAQFLASEEGRILLALAGGMAALMVQLMQPDPWLGYDGRHPVAPRPSRRERLLERIAAGRDVPPQVQILSVKTYAMWKLTGEPECGPGLMPEDAVFIKPVQAAAINAMSAMTVQDIVARLDLARRSGSGYRSILHDLDKVGVEAMGRWPGIEKPTPGIPLGIWIEQPDDDPAEEPDMAEVLGEAETSGYK